MEADLLEALLRATLASSLAVLLVGLLRKPFRVVMGARAAYWSWLLVPALVLALLLPAPVHVLQFSSVSLAGQVAAAYSTAVSTPMPRGSMAAIAALTLWAAGACAMFVLLLSRQTSFVRSLGELLPDTNGFHRSSSVVAPMLVGAWNPRIVVPLDFEARYSAEERELVLAHEQTHHLRRDVSVNAVASVWLCLSWFNPLVYWAIGWLRTDQELACDAQVLARCGDARRTYANALLKTQLATESGWRMPIGCHWQSSHSLKERIVMLKRPLPGMPRRMIGVVSLLCLVGSGSYAAWAAQVTGAEDPPILVTLRVTVTTTNEGSTDTFAAATQYLVRSGEPAPTSDTLPHAFGCTPFLTDAQRQAPPPAKGMILLECAIRYDGEVVATPSVLAFDGEEATIDTADRKGLRHYKIQLTATTSAERIAAAHKAAQR